MAQKTTRHNVALTSEVYDMLHAFATHYTDKLGLPVSLGAAVGLALKEAARVGGATYVSPATRGGGHMTEEQKKQIAADALAGRDVFAAR